MYPWLRALLEVGVETMAYAPTGAPKGRGVSNTDVFFKLREWVSVVLDAQDYTGDDDGVDVLRFLYEDEVARDAALTVFRLSGKRDFVAYVRGLYAERREARADG